MGEIERKARAVVAAGDVDAAVKLYEQELGPAIDEMTQALGHLYGEKRWHWAGFRIEWNRASSGVGVVLGLFGLLSIVVHTPWGELCVYRPDKDKVDPTQPAS